MSYSPPRLHRCCSVDGDADRLVYFSPVSGDGASSAISLLDGDKVAMLAAVYIRDIMSQLPAELLQGIQVWRVGGGV
jgi:phosphoacetylglucosamine mutase